MILSLLQFWVIGYQLGFCLGIEASVNTADSLHETNRIPMDVVGSRCVLKVQTLGQDVGGYQHPNLLLARLLKCGTAGTVVVRCKPPGSLLHD